MIGIVGANGFIGRSLLDYYEDKHIPTIAYIRKRSAIDRFHFGALPKIRELTLGQAFDPKIFDGVDTLVLSVSATHPRTEGNSKEREMELNVVPHQRFIASLLESDIQHVIYLSSGGAIYGTNETGIPISETATPKPVTPYGYGKICTEEVLQKIWTGGGRRLTILRPSNPVGLHQRKSINNHGLLPTVFENIRNGKTIRVFGDGSTIKDYFAVEDLCGLIDKIAKVPPTKNLTLNVSSGVGQSITDIIRCASIELKRPARIHYRQSAQPKIHKNILSSQAANTAFGWTAISSVTDIFRRFNQKEKQIQRIQNLIDG